MRKQILATGMAMALLYLPEMHSANFSLCKVKQARRQELLSSRMSKPGALLLVQSPNVFPSRTNVMPPFTTSRDVNRSHAVKQPVARTPVSKVEQKTKEGKGVCTAERALCGGRRQDGLRIPPSSPRVFEIESVHVEIAWNGW